MDNIPVLDLKPYVRYRVRVKDAVLPKFKDFYEHAEWFPEDVLN